MRTFVTLSLVLIGGILGSTIADKDSTRSKTVPQYSRDIGFINTTYEDIENFDLKICEKNGGPGAYDIQKEAFRNFSSCVFVVYSEVSSLNNLNPLDGDGNNVFSRRHCERISSYENCLKNLTESIKICLDPEKHETTHILYNSLSKIMRFLCKDNGNALTYLNGLGRSACLRSRENDFFSCANQTIVNYLHTIIPDGVKLGGLTTIHLLEPNVEKCNVFGKFHNCVMDEVKNCSDEKANDLVNSLFNIVKEVATCDRLVKSNASSYYGDILLITVLTAIASRGFVLE